MRYRDLIQFEPIDSVIQLRDANRVGEGRRLVSTFVISDQLAERLSILVAQLSFDPDVDHKGVLVVGNYGTGKSHLMSVISLVAEDAAYRPMLRHPKVQAAADAIAGQFKVHRIEISTTMSLREIVTDELGRCLRDLGVDFAFPPADQVVNNKASFEAMMDAFHGAYPDQGLLLVVDELLDFLRSRKDHELVLDLSVLREIGEVCKHLRLRFIAGVQEAVFDSSRFQHVADSLRRVKDRFTQLLLVREDVSFVVAERLLRKTADQQVKIRDYLAPFSKYYGSMNERMDDYVRLFPVHPDYIATFERIAFADKRGALETLRDQIQPLLPQEVPSDHPALLAYDSFWQRIAGKPELRADPAISAVMAVSEVLTGRIQQAFTRPAYKPIALRLIAALSVQRLTTGGEVYVPIGPTAAELRDGLCLFHAGIDAMGGDPADDLLNLVLTTLREILRTVNGQFISKAQGTDQFYLDLKKDIDYDAQIDKRAETLSDNALDRAYFSAVRQLMERSEETVYITGFQIWEYRIEWQQRRVERTGYLFFGAPNDRPTAQPPRDFYIYFLQPFDPPRFKDQHLADEVFFRLKAPDEALRRHITVYAAARDLALASSGNAKHVYTDKANAALRAMSEWLQQHQMTALQVGQGGKAKPLQDWLRGMNLRSKAHLSPDDRANFRDLVNVVAGVALAPHFEDLAPEYPSFPLLVTQLNRKQLVLNALKAVAGGPRTKEAMALLDALELLDGDRLDALRSRYARAVLERLKQQPQGHVLNRAELLELAPDDGWDAEFFAPQRFRLEPDLLVVVLAALVQNGDLLLAIPGEKIDAGKLDRLTAHTLDELAAFKHIEAPKALDLDVLRALLAFLGLHPGLATLAAQGSDEPVKQLQDAVGEQVRRALKAGTDLQGRLVFWGQSLLRREELDDWQRRLGSLKTFIEDVTPYHSVGRLKNLRIGLADIEQQQANRSVLGAVEALGQLVADLGPVAAYLSQAQIVVPKESPWNQDAQRVRTGTLALLETVKSDPAALAPVAAKCRQTLGQLKRDYLAEYIGLHAKARLGVSEDRTKQGLLADPRLKTLRTLAGIPLLPAGQITGFEQRLHALRSCWQLTDKELTASPICPHCQFQPANEALPLGVPHSLLAQLDDALDAMLTAWTNKLLEELGKPDIRARLDLLQDAHRQVIAACLAAGTLPDPLPDDFRPAVQEALSGLERIDLGTDEIRLALLDGGSPATGAELRSRFERFLADRGKGKDAGKLRFVVD